MAWIKWHDITKERPPHFPCNYLVSGDAKHGFVRSQEAWLCGDGTSWEIDHEELLEGVKWWAHMPKTPYSRRNKA